MNRYPLTFDQAITILRRELSDYQPDDKLVSRYALPSFLTVNAEALQGMSQKAVLLLLYPIDDMPFLALHRRAATMRTEASVYAPPGGGMDPGESPEETAVREAGEELDIDLSVQCVINRLVAVNREKSRMWIQAVVGCIEFRPSFTPPPLDHNEVAAIFEIPLEEILSDTAVRRAKYGRNDYDEPCFELESSFTHSVHGDEPLIQLFGPSSVFLGALRDIFLSAENG